MLNADQINLTQKIQKSLNTNDLHIKDILSKFTLPSGKYNLTKIAKQISEHSDNSEIKKLKNYLDISKEAKELTKELTELAKKPKELEKFVYAFVETMFSSGLVKPARLNQEVHQFLNKINKDLEKVLVYSNDSHKLLQNTVKLKKIETQIIDFSIINPNLNLINYTALNQLYENLQILKNENTKQYLKTLPEKLQALLKKEALINLDTLRKVAPDLNLSDLIKSDAVSVLKKPAHQLLVSSQAKINSDKYEKLLSANQREILAQAVLNELKTSYKGLTGLSCSLTNPKNIDSIRDKIRIEKISEMSEADPILVKLALSYYYEKGLTKIKDHSYVLSSAGKHFGLGIKATRIIDNAKKNGEVTNGKISLEKYLEAVKTMQKEWEIPTYTFKTKDGACPWIFLLDEFHAGEGRIDADLVNQLIKEIADSKDGLVVASNMLQGSQSVEPKAMRTSLPKELVDGINYSDYKNQLKLVTEEIYKRLNKPVLHIQGKNELETAQEKADLQRPRDISVLNGIEKPEEASVKNNLATINAITERANRKYSAQIHAQILEFVFKIEMPLELQLGREFMDANEIARKTGLYNINEREIVRDIVGLLINDKNKKISKGLDKIKHDYADFLALPEVGEKYIQKIKELVFNTNTELTTGQVAVKDGAYVQLLTPDNKKSLLLAFLPEFRMGVSESKAPTEKIISVLKSKTAAGQTLPDIVVVGATGQSFLSLTAAGTLVVSPDTLQRSSVFHDYLRNEATNRHKRRRISKAGECLGGAIAFSGGVHENKQTGDLIKTDAYKLKIWNEKVQQVLEDNRQRGLKEKTVEVYATSDFQTGSPTSRPDVWLKGMIDAVVDGCKEIVINGDVIQGQNYPREPIEAQLTGIIGIEDQQQFVYTLMQPVLEIIKELKLKDPNYEIPTFRIVTGNHETNSQAHKGGQGIWFLHSLASQVQSFYQAAFGMEIANSHVQYPRKFKDRKGTDVDYSVAIIDLTDEVGFRLAAQHYVGVGAKGSKTAPPVIGSQQWARSLENEVAPIHGWIWAHYHTQSFTQADGMFHTIFGANADGSGFEWHLGYPTTVPASGRIKLSSKEAPELMFVTEPYLNLQEHKWLEKSSSYKNLITKYGSLENFIEEMTTDCKKRSSGATDFTKIKKGRHNFIEPNRKVA
jgi:hypothetical protein